MTTPEHHAEAILRAAGSSLANYTMPGTRQAILDAVREAMGSGWQGIESAPKDGQMVLLFSPAADPTVSVGYHDDDDRNWLIVECDMMPSICRPVAWQPLPLPPSDGGR